MIVELGFNLDSKENPYNKDDLMARLATVPKGKLCLTKFTKEDPHMVKITNVLGVVASYTEKDGNLTFDIRPLDSMVDEMIYLNNLSACGIGEVTETLSVDNFLIGKMYIADENFKAVDFSHFPIGDASKFSFNEKLDWPSFLSFIDKAYLIDLCNDFAKEKKIHSGNIIWAQMRETQRSGGFDYLITLAVKYNDKNMAPQIVAFPFELQTIKSGGYKFTLIRTN